MNAIPVSVGMYGGALGLLLFALVATVVLWFRGDPPPEERRCDCFTCTMAREWREREEGLG